MRFATWRKTQAILTPSQNIERVRQKRLIFNMDGELIVCNYVRRETRSNLAKMKANIYSLNPKTMNVFPQNMNRAIQAIGCKVA